MVTGSTCSLTTGRDSPTTGETTPYQLARLCARRYTIPGMTADDLEQEAALAVLQALPAHDLAQHGPLEGYLTNRITARLSRLLEQAKRRTGRLRPLTGQEEGGEASDCGELAELARRYLTPRAARVIEMTAENWSDEEIAANLGMSPGAVRVMRSRAVVCLRDSACSWGNDR